MNHSRVRARLNDYVDRELPIAQRRAVTEHLEGCGECSQEHLELEATRMMLRRLDEPEPPPGFASAVIARIRDGEAEPAGLLERFRDWLGVPMFVPAGAALAGFAVFALAQQGGLTAPEPDAAPQLAANPSPQTGPASSALVAVPTRPGTTLAATGADRTGERDLRGKVAEELRKRSLEFELARRGMPEEVARMLRGAGHPHSRSLASHFEDGHFDGVELALISGVPRRLVRR